MCIRDRSWKKDNSSNRTGGAAKPAPKPSGGSKKMLDLENSEEAGRHETVSLALRQLIQKGRIAKKLTQAQVAKAINEKQQTINEYENGKAIPNGAVLVKLQKVLGVKLTGLKKK
eukprot:TRINITY_DN659_c0_g1_i2.p2 TRINITY_DN659_c0_g1~~TRINITY_DN659_c0_g1_i2.p2  ORF type:complete len:115 (-),score=37.56 TRINITY_DN659_c0_g1_i2:151-495(-)